MMLRRSRPATLLAAALCCVSLGGCQTMRSLLSPAEAGAGGAENAATLTRLGDHTLTQGDLATAIALYQRANAAAPDQPEPLIKLGSALYQIGNYEQSAGAYRSAVEKAPNNAQAQRGYGNALIALGRPAAAMPYLQRAVTLEPSAANRNSLGVVLDMMGRHAEAQAGYLAGITADPNDLDLASNYALSLALSGRLDEAVGRAREAAAAPGARIRHRQNLALILGLAGRDNEAAEIIRADLGDAAVAPSLEAFGRFRAMPDSGARAIAIGGGAGAGAQQN